MNFRDLPNLHTDAARTICRNTNTIRRVEDIEYGSVLLLREIENMALALDNEIKVLQNIVDEFKNKEQ